MLLAVLSVVQPLLGIAHAQAHAHRYCLAHQAFEEAAAGTGTALSQAGQSTQAFEKVATPAPGTSRHEACSFVSSSRREECPAPELPTLARRDFTVGAPAPAPARAQSSLSVLANAPKASPPTRA